MAEHFQGLYAPPKLIETVRIPFVKAPDMDNNVFFDVKFYPYSRPSKNPIFAIVGGRDVLICSLDSASERPLRVLHSLRDQEDKPEGGVDILNSCAWNYITNADALLAVTGGSGLIKVFHAVHATLFTTLIGHGFGTVNDLSTHPLYPYILASGSVDASIRIWDLRRCTDTTLSPCVIICGHGQGHKEGILKIAWHASGRYLLSGGHDHLICLWTIPDLSPQSPFWTTIAKENCQRTSDTIKVIHYPHFATSAIHSDFVDCVAFYGDCIISKSASDNIVFWKINGFDSSQPPPEEVSAPKTAEYKTTRSAFWTEETEHQLYRRLLEFYLYIEKQFWYRFSLLLPTPAHPDLPPVLAFGDTQSKIHFWELGLLASSSSNSTLDDPVLDDLDEMSKKNRKPNGTAVQTPSSRGRVSLDSGTPSTHRSASIQTSTSNLSTSFDVRDKKVDISSPFSAIKPHHTLTLKDFPRNGFHARGLDWSGDGRWCVVAGEGGGDAIGLVLGYGHS